MSKRPSNLHWTRALSGTLFSLLSAGLLPLPLLAQSTASICANVCPRADYTLGEYQRCIQTCSAQASKCLAQKRTGILFPKYYVLGLVYAPPGCTKTPALSCATQSSVDYQNGSTMGSKISTASSFSSDLTVTASLSIGTDPVGGKFGGTASGGWTTTSSDSKTETVTKGNSLDINQSGNGDGINHDQDTFLLLLNPAIALRQSNIFNGPGECSAGTVSWLFGLNTAQIPNGALYKITLGQLKNPSTMPAAVAAQLRALNFTTADYQTILALNPFANGPAAIDSARYVPTTTSFPYEPPDQSAECQSLEYRG